MNPLGTPPQIDWFPVLPVITVVVAGMLALAVELLRPKATNGAVAAVSLLGLLVSGGFVVAGFGKPAGVTFAGMVLHDAFGSAIQLLLLAAAFLSILFSEHYLREKRIAFAEFYPLALWATAGAMMMATTRNLLMVFVGLETLSVALYVLAGLSRDEERSEESAIKYFLLGAFATGFFLFGVAFFFGATGGLDLGLAIRAAGSGMPYVDTFLVAGLALILIGLSFKCGFVPFHQWMPDVYQGAPTNVTAFMAAVAKLGAFAVLWRVLESFGPFQAFWLPPLFWIAIATMTLGNLAALVQKDVKRVLGYSSVAHAGYLLVAVLAHAKDPAEVGSFTLAYYLLSYSLMTIGAFAVISLGAQGGAESTTLDGLKGLAQRSPFAAGCLVIFMLSLVGLPPTSGFVGKLLIFRDALTAGLTPLAIVLALNSVVSCYYYLGIAYAALTPREGERPAPTLAWGVRGAALLCAAGIFASAVFFGPIQSLFGLR